MAVPHPYGQTKVQIRNSFHVSTRIRLEVSIDILLMEEIQLLEPVEVGSLSHSLQGFVHPRCCRISSTNGIIQFSTTSVLYQQV